MRSSALWRAGRRGLAGATLAALSLFRSAGAEPPAGRESIVPPVTVGREVALRLADAGRKVVSPYRTGVKIDLSGWRRPGELVAEEKATQARRLDWPRPWTRAPRTTGAPRGPSPGSGTAG